MGSSLLKMNSETGSFPLMLVRQMVALQQKVTWKLELGWPVFWTGTLPGGSVRVASGWHLSHFCCPWQAGRHLALKGAREHLPVAAILPHPYSCFPNEPFASCHPTSTHWH